jgi:HSP20 family molecular chaperone IbpA
MARIEHSIEVNVPAHTAYNQLTQFEEYPRFMEDVEEVRQIDDTHLHWHTRAGNLDMEWDAEITQQVPDRCIAWRNTSGPRYEGKIELQPMETERTRLTVSMECPAKQKLQAQHGDAEMMAAERAAHDLVRFKEFIEKLGAPASEGGAGERDALPVPSPRREVRAVGNGAQGSDRQEGAGEADKELIRHQGLPNFFQVWNEPLGMMRRIAEDMDHMIERFLGRSTYATGLQAIATPSAWVPVVEIAQREDRFIVCAELAGVKREDVHVEVKGDRLTIEGERRPDPPPAPQEPRRSERAYGHFYREFALPPGADINGASASLHDGMLDVVVPVAGHAQQGRRLEIRSPE